jgi:hypothetical protein
VIAVLEDVGQVDELVLVVDLVERALVQEAESQPPGGAGHASLQSGDTACPVVRRIGTKTRRAEVQ